MARRFVSASSQFLQRTSTPLTGAYPFTMCAWFRPTTSNVTQTVLGLGRNTGVTPNNYHVIGVTSAAKPFLETDAGTAVDSIHATSVANGVWGHILGVGASATSRSIYFNGINPVANATSQTPTTLTTVTIGALQNGTTRTSYANGDIAECAMWNVVLNQDEITMLALGISPLLIRPSALVFYAPVWGVHSPEPDLKAAGGMTVTGATAIDHPRLFDTHGTIIVPKTVAPASTPKSGTDANGSTTESAGVVVQLTATDSDATVEATLLGLVGTDVSGTFTELGSISVPIAASDVNAGIVETTLLGLAGSDANGTVTETPTQVASETAADANGATTELGKLNLSGVDSNAVTTEVASETAAIVPLDTGGATTETGVLVAVEAATDQNAGVTEVTSLRLSGSDSGTETDANVLVTQEVGTDSNSTTTELATTNTPKSDTDANATTTEAPTLLDKTTATDAGTDSEAASYTYILAAQTDANAATTETGTPKAVESAADANGVTTESASAGTQTQVNGTDSGTAQEAATPLAILTGTDSSSSTQTALLSALITSPDGTGSTIENALIVARLVAAELGIGNDITNLHITVLSPDSGGAIIEAAKIGLIGTQIGSAVDAQAILVSIIDTENGNALEAQVLLVHGRLVNPNAPHELLGVSMERAVLTGSGAPAATLVGAQAPPAGKVTGAIKPPAQAQIAKSTIDAILSGVKKPNG